MFNPANLLTSLNLLAGVLGIIAALTGQYSLVFVLILFAALFDFLDGMVARMFGYKSELGKQLDSLADMVSFGVLPGVMMMVLIANGIASEDTTNNTLMTLFPAMAQGDFSAALVLVPLVIPFFSLFRLAKFNLDERQLDSFIGLPTPANTFFLLSFLLVHTFPEYTPRGLEQVTATLLSPVILALISVLCSVMLIMPISLFSLKFKHFGWKGNEFRWTLLIISPIIILVFQTWSLALIVSLYLLLSFIYNLKSKVNSDEV